MAISKKKLIIGTIVLLIIVFAIVLRVINTNKPSANTTDIMNYCDENIEDCTVDLIVVDVNNTGATQQTHNLTAYNNSGKTVVSGEATLAANTWQMIGEPSVFSERGNTGTPLGLYKRGIVWSSTQNDPDVTTIIAVSRTQINTVAYLLN